MEKSPVVTEVIRIEQDTLITVLPVNTTASFSYLDDNSNLP